MTDLRIPFKYTLSKKYWILRRRVQFFQFRVKEQRYRIKYHFHKEKRTANLFIHHIKSTLWSSIKAVGIVAVILFIEKFVTDYWEANLNSFPNWLIKLQELLPKPTYPDESVL